MNYPRVCLECKLGLCPPESMLAHVESCYNLSSLPSSKAVHESGCDIRAACCS